MSEDRQTESVPSALGERFEQALQFAAATHRTQVRKGSGIPYVGHLLGVCSLVIEDGGSEDEAIAALLHDAAEDQGGERRLAEIRTRFGVDVADIVAACSDTFETPKPAWQERKQTYIDHLDGQPEAVLRVSLADKLFNARAILRDYLLVGDQIWDRFKAGRDGQLWYYRELADRFSRLLPGRMAVELGEVRSSSGSPSLAESPESLSSSRAVTDVPALDPLLFRRCSAGVSLTTLAIDVVEHLSIARSIQ